LKHAIDNEEIKEKVNNTDSLAIANLIPTWESYSKFKIQISIL